MSCFGRTYTKIGTIQRRLAWPLRKDDTQNREAFHIFCNRHYLIYNNHFINFSNIATYFPLNRVSFDLFRQSGNIYRTVDRIQPASILKLIFIWLKSVLLLNLERNIQFFVSKNSYFRKVFYMLSWLLAFCILFNTCYLRLSWQQRLQFGNWKLCSRRLQVQAQ